MNFYNLKINPFIFALFSISLAFSQQSDTLKPNPCDTKSDCYGCNCILKNDSKYSLGIDLAFQGIKGGLSDIRWDSVLANPDIKFILIKKSTGCDTSTKKVKYGDTLETRIKVSIDNDKFFSENWNFLNSIKQSKQSNVHYGVYHYFYNGVSSEMQTETFLRDLILKSDDLPPVLDLEDTAMATIDSKTLGENILNWIQQVENSTNRKVIIYTSRYFWDKYKTKLNKETLELVFNHPLWLAQFNHKKESPDLPIGWKSWKFWQYCGDCRVSGINGELDVNVFNGTQTDLQNFINDSKIK